MKILGFEIGRKSAPPQETITPPGPTSPAPGSPEARQATANRLAEDLARLKNGAAIGKETGKASVDGPAIATLEKKLSETGVDPTIDPVIKSPTFSTPPPPPVTFGQPEGLKPSAATTESLAADVTKLARADAESEATASVPPQPASTLDKAA